MKKAKMEDTRKQFADRLIQKQVEAPIQQVGIPDSLQQTETINKMRTKADEAQLNVHVNVDLLKRLKLKGVTEDKNIKEMISEAITMYLNS